MKAGAKIDVIYILSEKSSGSSFLFRSLKDALNIKTYPKTIHFESETLYWTKAASLLDKPQLKMLASAVPYPKARARKEIQDFLKDDPELTDEERFELYYDEREKRREKKSGMSYEQLLKKSGVLPPSTNK